MSEGQKQRITIARVVIKAPQMVILDKATSALDSKSKQMVQEVLDNTVVGRTTMIIAHHFSTIRSTNIIVAVQDGQVMEMALTTNSCKTPTNSTLLSSASSKPISH